MDIRERSGDLFEALRTQLDGRQVAIWTALPGIIQSFDPGEPGGEGPTCVVQPAIQGRVTSVDPGTGQATTKFVNLPQLLDCPVQFPAGGGCSLTFPVQKGDECLVVFASRCIDAWWAQGGVQPPMEARMHDLSDGFVLLGFRSNPRALANISTTTTQLRSDDGSTFVEVNPLGSVNVTAPHGAVITGEVAITGSLDVSGNMTVGNGASGSFTSSEGLTITVQDGQITNIY